MTVILKVIGWGVIIAASLSFLVFTILPLLDTNDSVVFEAGAFGFALGRFVGFVGICGILPLLAARRVQRR